MFKTAMLHSLHMLHCCSLHCLCLFKITSLSSEVPTFRPPTDGFATATTHSITRDHSPSPEPSRQIAKNSHTNYTAAQSAQKALIPLRYVKSRFPSFCYHCSSCSKTLQRQKPATYLIPAGISAKTLRRRRDEKVRDLVLIGTGACTPRAAKQSTVHTDFSCLSVSVLEVCRSKGSREV